MKGRGIESVEGNTKWRHENITQKVTITRKGYLVYYHDVYFRYTAYLKIYIQNIIPGPESPLEPEDLPPGELTPTSCNNFCFENIEPSLICSFVKLMDFLTHLTLFDFQKQKSSDTSLTWKVLLDLWK